MFLPPKDIRLEHARVSRIHSFLIIIIYILSQQTLDSHDRTAILIRRLAEFLARLYKKDAFPFFWQLAIQWINHEGAWR
jgi:hypothetical protein